MATHVQSPSGFSYAQAAKGKPSTASHTPSKTNSGSTTTPFTELGSNQTWADDVESSTTEKVTENPTQAEEQGKAQVVVKDTVVERTKTENTAPNGISGISSPDTASASTTTANTDDSSSAPNGTSASESTTWETKSQGSEPAWIVERKERQSTESHNSGNSSNQKNGKKDAKEAAVPQAPPKPPVLHDAPPPAVNPWAKRAEGLKKPGPPQFAPKPAAGPAVQSSNVKDSQAPRGDARRKAHSVASVAREPEQQAAAAAAAAAAAVDSKDTRNIQGEASGDAVASATRKPAQREHQSLPTLVASVSAGDDLSWPTPEIAHEKERSDSHVERESGEDNDGEAGSNAKLAKKKEWKVFPVTPNVIWATQDLNRPPRAQGSERGRGNSSSGRGRGGHRGAPNGTKGGDRATGRNSGAHGETEKSGSSGTRGRTSPADRLAVASAAKSGQSSGTSKSRERGTGRNQSTARNQNSSKASAGTVEEVLSASATAFSSTARLQESPEKAGATEPDAQEDAKASGSNSRPEHAAAQGDAARTASDAVAREGVSSRRVTSDGRKESRSYENYKEWNGAPRGSKRGGRGRGGSREFTNGHQTNQTFANNHTEFLPSGSYGGQASPSGFQGSRPSQQFGFNSQGRGGWPRGNPRSQSIPVDNIYGGRFPQFPPPNQPLQIPSPYLGSMLEYGMPMTAIPYHPAMQNQMLAGAVSSQLDYYFSIDNLLKDMFLRKHMDSQGFVFLDVIANFNRVKNLSTDTDLIRAACLRSEQIEIRIGEDGKERIRRREKWEQFVLPMEQRESSAQTEGPKVLQRPEQPQMQFWTPEAYPLRSPQSAGIVGSHMHRPFDSPAFPPMNGLMPQFAPFTPLPDGSYGDMTNGEEMRGRSAKSPLRDPSNSSGHRAMLVGPDGKELEPDMFPDEHINALTVVVKMNQTPEAALSPSSRTFSNGSIDSRHVASEAGKADENRTSASTGEKAINGDSQTASESRSPDPNRIGSEMSVLWLKNKDLPQDHLPQDATLEPYVQLRLKALKQRTQAATGTCPYDLDVLYQFWSHFLIRNFNSKMYGEFKYYANDDAKERHSEIGLQNLVQFYAKALISSNPIRDLIVHDYVDLVHNEPAILQGRASKQLRSAWRNGALNLKNRKKLADIVDDALKAQLDEA